MHPKICTALLLFAALPASSRPLSGQAFDVEMQRGPRFFLASAGDARPVRIDPSRVSLLRTRISTDFENVKLEKALEVIAAQSGTRIAYSRALVPLESRVSLSATNISIAAALTEVLLDTGVDVVISRTGQITLTPRESDPVEQEPGTIIGRVTQAETGDAIVNAQISVDGQGRAVTNDEGAYRIDGVTPGRRTVTVTSIGYARASREVEVSDGATATIDFTLQVSPTTLNELVVTATGEQRRVELGHVVGRIQADSLVREAPVSSITELLTSRIPGLLVQQAQGTVGGDVELQIRSATSTRLSTAPVVIIDGTRYTVDPITGPSEYRLDPFSTEPTSRLNDLNPNDIETIEVVMGPSAATLYGTDAANGVIVITTKRGHAGPARWSAYAKGATTDIPRFHYPDSYWGWHTTQSAPARSSCPLLDVAAGGCAQDSITLLPSPLNDPAFTILAEQPRWEYGANVSGGREDVRYYFSGDIERAIGPVRMPRSVLDSLGASREVSEEQRDPNGFTKANVRANFTASVGKDAELRISTGYTRSATRTISPFIPYPNAVSSPTAPYQDPSEAPATMFAQMSTETINRFSGSVSGDWRPWSWLSARGTLGLDFTSSTHYSLARNGEAQFSRYPTGVVGETRARYVLSKADVGATATFRRGPLSSRTSAGVQYVRNLHDHLRNEGQGLPPGGSSIPEATSVSTFQEYDETVTLGSYLEETIGLNDRLWLTGALRVDGATGFGRDYDAAFYPKAGVSWLVSETPFLSRVPGLDELRLRYAFGASGSQAWPVWARPSFYVQRVFVDGQVSSGAGIGSLGNPDLRPERVQEHELGLDASVLEGRLRLDLTWYHRRTVDQLQEITLGAGLGSMWTNLGLITGRGFEAQLTTRLLESRRVRWEVRVNHAWHTSKLVDWGDQAFDSDLASGGFVEGYPLGAVFSRPIAAYSDVNGNGIIESTEVQLGDLAYVGQSTPPHTSALSTMLDLFNGHLRLSALVDRQSGFVQRNALWQGQCHILRCRAAVDPGAPVAEQAAVAALQLTGGFNFGFMEAGDFTRLRELALSLDLPQGLVHAIGLREVAIGLQGRNLLLWTDFAGTDPESRTGGLPQARSWMLRLDVGF